ncbi:MAG: hypothetical protein HY096_09815 [Nitrospinae bacterium]|nr:hypothetical protein [Nitrospinota bacterium]
MSGYWYCNNCESEINERQVTYEETHERCGCPVEWINEGGGVIKEIYIYLDGELHCVISDNESSAAVIATLAELNPARVLTTQKVEREHD